ncbi:MAG TPA: FtsH protease activity modulator HflK [Methylibium sp.]|uniref:FtsH protease activity modulator HflK n=1 Tax=Methylibium sp. TaxID=2067992 RepID=UPI002DB921F6|nr:FtsH protease activity modulator HflK [Methylibium sp.]HEU4460223.1 FtsH protease activity modulator HflK [Methylibium sp.]
MNPSTLAGDRLPNSIAGALAALFAGLARRLAWRARPSVLMAGGRNDGPPDLDELWRDFNRKLSGLFGGRGGARPEPSGGGGGSTPPDMRGAGIGALLIAGVAVLIWLGTGFFIVQEGQQGVVMSFGRYSHTVEAGFQWRGPYPFQSHEVVSFTQLRSKEIGRSGTVQATGLRDSSMLTQDENIVDIRFTVQYRLKDARDFLFENQNAEDAVVLAAESAVREIVGRSNMDSVLYEQRDAIASDLVKSIQAQLDRLKTGILVTNVNVQSVAPPEQVQAAFDDAVKAVADRTRFKNEGEAYANDVIPKAQGTASRLREEAEGYRGRVIAQAEGDGSRFKQVLAEYQKAPAVTRDRLYTDTMREVYGNVSKVLVESRTGSNLLYLPLDKLMQAAGQAQGSPSASMAPAAAPETNAPTPAIDPRSRENQRTRERESR